MRIHIVLLGGLLACGGSEPRLVIEPADLTVTIIDDVAVTQPYKVRLQSANGGSIDVTGEATFSMVNPAYGTFAGATLSVTGQGAGPTRVLATARGVNGDTGLTVHVKKTIVDPAAPPDAAGLFDRAVDDPSRAPVIVYPPDRILVPPNLGQFDVHWNNGPSFADLFEVAMENTYVDIRIYTRGLDPSAPYWTVFAPDSWYPIASSREQLALRVTGLDTTRPASKGTAKVQHVDVTNENTQGGIYYWTSSGAAGIWRYDVGTPNVAPAPYFADDARPSDCMGCHTLSRDGTKMAVTLDGATGRGAVFNVADRKPMFAYDVAAPLRWDFAAFDSRATRLVTVEDGQMYLRGLDGTALAGPLPPQAPGRFSTHPEISPDDRYLVNVEYTEGGDWEAYGGSIVIRSFNAAAGSFDAPRVLVPYAPGSAAYYPSFSPDGEWIVFTRTSDYSYNEPTAQTWLIKTDGSRPPIQLSAANLTGDLTNSWARWVPFAQTFGTDEEPLFYLTFSSQRAFGVRIPGGGRPQIWMTPVFPARAAAGQDPSGNAFRVPFQDVETNNHIAQWTEAVQ
jgi:hypothetical protein